MLPNDEILPMEAGWLTAGTGNEGEQRRFARALPWLLDGVNVSVVDSALLHDVELEAFDGNRDCVELLTTEGRRKPDLAEFPSRRLGSHPQPSPPVPAGTRIAGSRRGRDHLNGGRAPRTSRTGEETNMAECPVCGGDVELESDAVVGELLECPDCGSELEVLEVEPVALGEAPETEEDWGE